MGQVIDAIQKCSNALTIYQLICLAIPSGIIAGVVIFLMTNPFGFFLGIPVAIVILAIIAIFVQLKKIESAISIDFEKPYSHQEVGQTTKSASFKYHIINFPLRIVNNATISISVKEIRCMFTYNKLAIQNMVWRDGDAFASNGMNIAPITIKADKYGDQKCPFNPFPYIPNLPESNEGWGVNGTIKFQCFFRDFEVPFKSKDIALPNKWDDWRLEYQQLYNSVFSTMHEDKIG